MPDTKSIESTVNHLFRHQSGKMVAVLSRIFGTHNLELAEDVVQDTLLSALEQWKIKGIPDNPEGWLFIVAKNKALNLIRKKRSDILFGDDQTQVLLRSGYTVESTFQKLTDEVLIKDDQLRMMFTCCHPEISQENQVTLILKTLCGFSTAEIARAFLTNEESIAKRLYRTKEFFRENKIKLEIPSLAEISSRTEAVLSAIYLLFNEGYNSTHADSLIRKDLMEEAFQLCGLLAENEHTHIPEVFALMALICFHNARSESRLSAEGEIILLQKQDRSKWNKNLIALGNDFLNKAASGNKISTYHLEAAIAHEHCVSDSYEKTNWKNILNYYNLLNKISPSPVTELNRIIVILQLHGPKAALQELEKFADRKKLSSWYLYHSLLGEIYGQLKEYIKAKAAFEEALKLTRSAAEQSLLKNKISRLGAE